MKTKQISNERQMEVLVALLDGVNGYESETGYLRYWDPKTVEEAREIIKKHKRKEVQVSR